MEILDKITPILIEILPQFLLLIVLSIISFKVIRILSKTVKKLVMKNAARISKKQKAEFSKRIDTLASIIVAIGDIVIWAMIIVFVLGKAGIDVGPLIAGAGIFGVAIGFGSQELVRDMISGMFILLENQIRTGDVAIINGTGGLVEKIGLRTIILRDLSGIVHIFQNGKINSLSNMTNEWSAMIFDVGVAYKEDVDNVMEIMKNVGEELQKDPEFKNKIVEPLEVFGLDKFDDSAVVIKARIKTKPIEQWGVGREYRKRLKVAFDKFGIEIPFPHMSVYWGSDSDPFKVSSK